MEALAADDPRVIGDFRLQSRLGAGGMGRVYLGFSPAGRAVAVKVIHPHLARDPSFAARFRREVTAAQAVNASYATPVVAAGPDDTPPWLATAFVPAPTLGDVVHKNGPLPEEAVWKLAAGLAEALRAVHASGLVHRDLKPGNVLLAADGPRLIDFGIARVLDGTQLTNTDSVLGTPSYMSPEQAQGKPVEGPSDVFSLGGVVVFAATGQAPFGSGVPATLLYRIVFGEPQLDLLPPQLRSLVAACLDKNPAARPTPAQLATALMPAMPGGQLTPSRLAFWPEPVDQFIHDYRARLDAGPAPAPVSGGWPPPSAPGPGWPPAGDGTPPGGGTTAANGWRPAGEPTIGGLAAGPAQAPAPPPLGATTVRQAQHAQRTVVPALDRRRALAALAGAVTAGLGIAGWEIDDHLAGSGSGPAASQFKLPAVAPGTVAWKFSVGHPVASIAAAGNVVYVGIDANIVIAVNATTGRQLWRRATTSLENTNLVAAGGGVVAAGDKGPFALAAGTGKLLWKASTDGTPPMVAQGDVVYAGYAAKSDTTGGVTALGAAAGDVLWTYAFGPVADIAGGLAVSGGVVYATASDGEIFALSAASGARRQKVGGLGAFGAGTIAALGGVVYAGLDDKKGTVVAVDVASGKTVWQLPLGSSIYPPYVASASGLVLASIITPNAPTGGVYGLDPATGKPKWLAKIPGTPAWGPAVGGDVVYVGSGAKSGVLYAWDAATGKQRWSYTAPDSIGTGTVTAGSRVYVSAGQYVYSLGA